MDNQYIYQQNNNKSLLWYDDRVKTISSVARNTSSNVDGIYDTPKKIYKYLDKCGCGYPYLQQPFPRSQGKRDVCRPNGMRQDAYMALPAGAVPGQDRDRGRLQHYRRRLERRQKMEQPATVSHL